MALITRKSLLSVGLLLTVACNEPTAAPAIVSVTVTPSGDTILVGRAVQLMATTRDVSGNTLTGHTVTWTSSNSTVATVSVSGLVTGVSAGGPVTVTATSEGKRDCGDRGDPRTDRVCVSQHHRDGRWGVGVLRGPSRFSR